MKIRTHPSKNHLTICQNVIYSWLTITVLEYFHKTNPIALRPSGIKETMWGACKEAKKAYKRYFRGQKVEKTGRGKQNKSLCVKI